MRNRFVLHYKIVFIAILFGLLRCSGCNRKSSEDLPDGGAKTHTLNFFISFNSIAAREDILPILQPSPYTAGVTTYNEDYPLIDTRNDLFFALSDNILNRSDIATRSDAFDYDSASHILYSADSAISEEVGGSPVMDLLVSRVGIDGEVVSVSGDIDSDAGGLTYQMTVNPGVYSFSVSALSIESTAFFKADQLVQIALISSFKLGNSNTVSQIAGEIVGDLSGEIDLGTVDKKTATLILSEIDAEGLDLDIEESVALAFDTNQDEKSDAFETEDEDADTSEESNSTLSDDRDTEDNTSDTVTPGSLFTSPGWNPSDNLTDVLVSDMNEIRSVDMALNDNRDAVVSWVDEFFTLKLKLYRNGAWDDAMKVQNYLYFDVHGTSIDNNGNVLILWYAHRWDDLNKVYLMRKEFRNGAWLEKEEVMMVRTDDDDILCDMLSLELNTVIGVILFTGFDNSKNCQLYASVYQDGQWNDPNSINDYISFNSLAGDLGFPAVSINSSGNIIAAWTQEGSDGKARVYTGYYDAGWSLPTSESDALGVGLSDYYPPPSPTIALNDSGEAVLVWADENKIYLGEGNGRSWEGNEEPFFETETGSFIGMISVASSGAGEAMIAWNDVATTFGVAEKQNGEWAFPTILSETFVLSDYKVADNLTLSMGANGDVIIFGGDMSNPDLLKLFLFHRPKGEDWTNVASFGSGVLEDTFYMDQSFKTAMNTNGDVLSVWVGGALSDQIYAISYLK